jgi:hypothetical protein
MGCSPFICEQVDKKLQAIRRDSATGQPYQPHWDSPTPRPAREKEKDGYQPMQASNRLLIIMMGSLSTCVRIFVLNVESSWRMTHGK